MRILESPSILNIYLQGLVTSRPLFFSWHLFSRQWPTKFLRVAPCQASHLASGIETKEKTFKQIKTEKEAVETKEKAFEQEKAEKETADTKEKVSEQEKTQKEAVEAFLAKAWDNLMNHPVGRKRRIPSVASEHEKTQKEAVEAFLGEAWDNLMNHPVGRKRRAPCAESEHAKTQKEAVEAFLAQARKNQMNHPVRIESGTPSIPVSDTEEVPELKAMKSRL